MYNGQNPGGPVPQPQPQPVPRSVPPTPPVTPPPTVYPEFDPAPISDLGGGIGLSPTTGGALLFNDWLKRHWKLLILIFVALIILGETIFQIVYPSDRLIPGTKLDGVTIGGMTKDAAAARLDKDYGALKLAIYFGTNNAAFQTPKMSDVGVSVDNSARVSAMDYPFFFRIIPGSIFWATGLERPGMIAYNYNKDQIANYTQSEVGTSCSIPPKNASLQLIDSQLQLIPSVAGGTCDITQFQQALAQVIPSPSKPNTVRIDINETPAPVTDDMARTVAAKLNSRLATPMPIAVDSSTDTIPGRVVLSWLDFNALVPQQSIDNTGNQSASLQYTVNTDRMKAYLDQGIAAKLIIKPGVSHVSTTDFTETYRQNGSSGRDVDVVDTAKSVTDYINSKNNQAVGETQVVGPTVIYTRKYTPTSVGFSAMLAQYAQDNPGTWGLAFNELSGVQHPRSASFNATQQFPSVGVESLYLGYTDLIEQAAGVGRPVDIISGNTNEIDCFKLMFENSDPDCTNGFYNFYGYATIKARGQDLGLQNTTFAGQNTMTSAADLQKVMVGLYNNQVARQQGGQKILSDMRLNQNKQGISAGTGSSNSVTQATGESDTVHNDTAIVYDQDYGTYALTIMSNGTTWDEMSGLVKEIEALKTVKIPKGAV